jgi:hypothetical protein
MKHRTNRNFRQETCSLQGEGMPRMTLLGGAVVVLILLMAVFPGCRSGGTAKSAKAPARGANEPLYLVKAEAQTTVNLERKGKTEALPLPPEHGLFDQDIVENVGAKPASLSDPREGHRFILAPEARVQVGYQTLTMFRGKSLFEFRKVDGEFKIVLPKAMLGIRGTSFLVVVEPDGTSMVRMFEGRIEIDRQGEKMSLADQQSVVIGADGSTATVIEKDGDLPDLLRNRNADEEYLFLEPPYRPVRDSSH